MSGAAPTTVAAAAEPETTVAPPATGWSRYHLAAALAGAVLLALVTFGQVVGFGFVDWDDPLYVTENPVVRDGLTAASVRAAWTTLQASNWHPLTILSHQLDVELYGIRPAGHHFTNLVLHLLATLLVGLLLRALTGDAATSAFAAALFGVHPLHAESVAWVADRKDLLAACLGLLALLAWLRWARRKRVAAYVTSLVLVAASLLAKAMLVTFPVLLFALDVWPLRRLRRDTSQRELVWLVVEKLPFVALAIAVTAATIHAQGAALQTVDRVALDVRLATALVNYATQLGQALWPAELAFFVPHPRVFGEVWGAGRVALAAAVLVLVSVLAWRARRTRPAILAGWTFYLVTLLPVCGLVPLAMVARADRYMYLPLAGLALAAAAAGDAVLRRLDVRPALRWVIAIVLLLTLAARGYAQATIWRDDETLALAGLAVDPRNCVAHDLLGSVHSRAGRFVEAAAEHRLAFEQCRFPAAANNLGAALAGAGDHRAAVASFRWVLGVEPRNIDALANLGWSLAQLGDLATAREVLVRAVRIAPRSLAARNNLGVVLLLAGEPAAAIPHLEAVVAASPDELAAHVNLATAYESIGDAERAARHQAEASRLELRRPR